jgi:hypothetical protein
MQDCLGAWLALVEQTYFQSVFDEQSGTCSNTHAHTSRKCARSREHTHTHRTYTHSAHSRHTHNACAGFLPGLHQALHQTTSTAFWKWATWLPCRHGVPIDAHQEQVEKLLKTAIKNAQGRDILRGIVRDRNAQRASS